MTGEELAVGGGEDEWSKLPLRQKLNLKKIVYPAPVTPLAVLFGLDPFSANVSSYYRLLLERITQRCQEADAEIDAMLRDFDGTLVSHRAFARVHAARIAPTVVAFDGRGARRGKPIVGAKIPEFYGHYLGALLERALAPQGLR